MFLTYLQITVKSGGLAIINKNQTHQQAPTTNLTSEPSKSNSQQSPAESQKTVSLIYFLYYRTSVNIKYRP
jgi:hypothetical protein